MKHLFLLYWIISFSIGFTTFIALILIYFRFQNITLKYYIMQMLCLSILVITSGIKQYHDLNLPLISQKLIIYLDIISLLVEGFIPLLCVLFATSFINYPYKKVINILFIIFSNIFLFLLLSTYLFFLKNFPVINIIYLCFLSFSIIYSIYIIIYYFKQIKNKIMRSYLYSLFVLGLFSFTSFILDIVINFKEKITMVTSSFRIGVGIYLFWNLLTIIFFIRYFFSKDSNMTYEKFELFFTKNNISEREKEVVKLIIQGKSNIQIADLLFISEGTVKRHIHNIYEKTKAKTRMELAFLIRNS